MESDWRVRVAQVLVDGIIACGIMLLMYLRVIDVTVGIAIIAPVIGAMAAVRKDKQPGSAGAGGPTSGSGAGSAAGGTMALVFAVASLLSLLKKAPPVAVMVAALCLASCT